MSCQPGVMEYNKWYWHTPLLIFQIWLHPFTTGIKKRLTGERFEQIFLFAKETKPEVVFVQMFKMIDKCQAVWAGDWKASFNQQRLTSLFLAGREVFAMLGWKWCISHTIPLADQMDRIATIQIKYKPRKLKQYCFEDSIIFVH